jgi:hypothetical protein
VSCSWNYTVAKATTGVGGPALHQTAESPVTTKSLEIDLHAGLKDVDVTFGLAIRDATKTVIEAPFDM